MDQVTEKKTQLSPELLTTLAAWLLENMNLDVDTAVVEHVIQSIPPLEPYWFAALRERYKEVDATTRSCLASVMYWLNHKKGNRFIRRSAMQRAILIMLCEISDCGTTFESRKFHAREVLNDAFRNDEAFYRVERIIEWYKLT